MNFYRKCFRHGLLISLAVTTKEGWLKHLSSGVHGRETEVTQGFVNSSMRFSELPSDLVVPRSSDVFSPSLEWWTSFSCDDVVELPFFVQLRALDTSAEVALMVLLLPERSLNVSRTSSPIRQIAALVVFIYCYFCVPSGCIYSIIINII